MRIENAKIESDEQYRRALERIDVIFQEPQGSELGNERDRLVPAVEEYEDREYPEFRRAREHNCPSP